MAALAPIAVLAILSTLLLCTNTVKSQVLTPPYFNLAVGKRVHATATCGEGVPEKELYCKLTGANPGRGAEEEPDFEVIQGQLCDYCHPRIPTQAHPPSNVLDGTEHWWQSPPLSRGLQFNEVNLTIDLGQEFHVAYVLIKMANSPRPGVFALERSTDYGQTWEAWQYFADTLSDCRTFFGDNFEEGITRDDSVICATEYSRVVPLEGGEIVVSLVNERPSAYNFSYASTLQEWTRATNVRLRLLRTKTLLGHLMAIVRQDPTVTRRYFYSIKDISIGGRCVCNGHAGVCDKTSLTDPYKLLCRCVHNTCGDQCERCCEGFVQKPWRPATSSNHNGCEPCNCHNHSTECYYDEEVARQRQSLDIHGRYDGGGVCQNCQHNTAGINCERCVPGYYRHHNVPRESATACQRCQCDPTYSTGECEEGTGRCKCRPEYTGLYCDRCNLGYYGYPRCIACDCNGNGTEGLVCEVGGGQCPCKPNYSGPNCDRCAYGYYGFPNCQPCRCDSTGSLDERCNPTSGECSCKINFGGRTCGECANGHYGYPNCQVCNCDPTGSTQEVCDKNYGGCLCQPGFGGYRCDRCETGFYRYPNCIECGCQNPGTQVNDCDAYGQCICQPNYEGLTCDRCARGYYNYPECTACNCDRSGSSNFTCNEVSGQCNCRSTFEGVKCDRCRPNFYNYPVCEECNCNPAGAKSIPGYPHGGCGSHAIAGRLCECKERVEGHICDKCKPGYWNLDTNNQRGCEDCSCYKPGTTGASRVCNTLGQCMCKPFVDGRRCDMCRDGTFNLQDYNIFGCEDCACDIGGSSSRVCDKSSGQCQCRPRVSGRMCEKPLDQHYFPTLYQHKYEMEDGHTPSGGAVRYGFDNAVFEDYSWRGYAIFSRLQDEVLVDVDIQKPSLYRLIFRYVSRNVGSVTAEVTITPMTSTDVQQTSTVVFQPAFHPEFVTVSGTGAFVLNPGRWTISLKTPESIFVDYLAVLPQGYYEATILQEHVNKPCKVPADNNPCLHYVYVDVLSYSVTKGETGYVTRNNQREHTQTFPDDAISSELGTSNMAHLNSQQTNLQLTVPVPSPGRYVFMVQYHSDETPSVQELEVDVTTRSQSVQGRLLLPGCPYSALCRRAVADAQGETLVVDVDGTHASMTLMGRANIDVAIDSVIAIPVDDWTVEFLQPRLKCIRMDKQCMQSTFVHPTGATPVEFESGPNQGRVETDIPPHIIDTSIKVIKVDNVAPSVSVKATVLNQGPHVVVIHYFQPHYVGFEVYVNVTVGANIYRGKFHANYCPGVSGCRSVVNFDESPDKMTVDLGDVDVFISVDSRSGRPIWLDYIMVIPRVQYNDDVLNVMPVDRAGIFLTQCGRDNFYMDPTSTGFCRDSIFSLTTSYNNGVMQCNCDPDGSTSLLCQEFGGQCTCKDHVIGRTCSQCRTGFYGFPNCRPCNCPSGLCDPRSGQCVCPPRVTGPSCNICLPRTFGFDPLIGCEDCNCDPNGVLNNDLECDIDIGQCSCKPNVGGRRCDRCLNGHFSFPRCIPCSCDARGTTDEICDQRDSSCLCKKNVAGPQCEQCKPGTFYLEERNHNGCTDCFCFGTTTLCDTASSLRRTQVRDMRGWGITNLQAPNQRPDGRGFTVDVRKADMIDQNEPLYWVAPEAYLGNKITSYGGKLIYSVRFTRSFDPDSRGVVKNDVVIEGKNMTLVHTAARQPVPGEALEVELDMLEIQFRHESSGALVTREQFMTVLASIRAMQIRASYYTLVDTVSLLDIHLDMAAANGTGSLARNVEMCTCPPNYRGSSCEECATGYYRVKNGPYLGICVQCQCNGRSNTCDPETGECFNCQDNYGGPQCIACRQGYYQDPYTGRCEICSCPMPLASNNFASTCEVNNGVVFRCICLPGYIGPRCDTCDIGYFGNPNEIGGRCEQCACNGNIDLRDARSCDPASGECLVCIHDTTGRNCERCRDWYHGDAINVKNCERCSCNLLGSELCEHETGICLCKPNVVGAECDRCAPGTFGFESGNGCQACNCGSGSRTSQCDETTGQCECQPGVTGRQCDRCQDGFWDYTPVGCRSCECKKDGATTCDPVNGKCHCLPGVTGDRCDRCMDRWVLIPARGCRECDSCVNLLIDDVVILDHNVTTIMHELESVSVGVTAMRRLEKINSTVHELRPLVDSLTPNKNPLDPLMKEMQKMKERAAKVKESSARALREAEVLEKDATDTLSDTGDLNTFVEDGAQVAQNAVRFAQEVLADILSNIHGQNVDQLIREAEQVLENIRNRMFDDNMIAIEDEFISARETLEKVKSLEDRMTDQMDRVTSLKENVDDISDRLYDLINSSRHSSDNSRAALDLVNRGNRVSATIQGDYSSIINLKDNTELLLTMARDLLQQSSTNLNDARDTYDTVEQKLSEMDGAIRSLSDYTDHLSDENQLLRPLVDNATRHALKLEQEAQFLDSMIADTRSSAEGALNASRAYEAIVEAINAAENASRQANIAAEDAQAKSNGLKDQAAVSVRQSDGLKRSAEDVKIMVQDRLQVRLDTAKSNLQYQTDLHDANEDRLSELLVQLDKIPSGGYSERAEMAANKAMGAQQRASDAEGRVKSIVDRLPEDEKRSVQIPNDINTANRDIIRAKTQVDNVINLIPRATTLIDSLTVDADRVNMLGHSLRGNISELRNNIDIAREEASRIRVGLTFEPDTVLQVRNPQNLEQAGSYTKLSLYFKTKEANGFLAYIGPEGDDDRSTSADYYALEIEDGKVVLKFNLGGGPAAVTNSRRVDDDVWHEVIAERTGQTATITVRTQDEDDVVGQGSIEGTFSVLDFKADMTKFFVGGVPASAKLGGRLNSMHYTGFVEDVMFDGVPVGLWDFVDGNYNNKGCTQRNKLISVSTNGFRFNGDGYVIMDKGRFIPDTRTGIRMEFKTYAKNGLMFLIGDSTDFMAIELHEGSILMQYDLGSGTAKLQSKETYNDGKWHVLFASRVGRRSIVKLDNIAVATGSTSGQANKLETDDNIYIGGHRGKHPYKDVTEKGFDGCIKEIRLGRTSRDINKNKVAKGVLPGCPEVARTVSFPTEVENAYIAMEPISINTKFQATMKFKSEQHDGLIMYVANDTQTHSFAISLVGGKIALSMNTGGQITHLKSDTSTYGDGHWHYITVNKDNRDLQLDIDDTEMVKTKAQGRKKLVTTSPLYFGGLPPGYRLIPDNVATQRHRFIGCIGDVTIQGSFVNFALAPSGGRVGASLAGCPIPDPTPATEPPTLAPTSLVTQLPGQFITDAMSGQCALPMNPVSIEADDDSDPSCFLFSSHPESRIEFDDTPDNYRSNDNNDTERYNFSLEFKTAAPDGMLFYVTDAVRQTDYIALYLMGGNIVYTFDCGSGAARMVSPSTYNDGQWHKVEFRRKRRVGTLIIDGSVVATGRSQGSSSSLNTNPPIYLGSLSAEMAITADSIFEGNFNPFVGAIRQVQMNDKPFELPTRTYEAKTCSATEEGGSFFYADGGHIKLMDNFKVGLDLEISIEIRPRSLSGVLLSVTSAGGDYLILQMINGEIRFSVDNGKGEFATTSTPQSPNALCDGRWHTIRATKAKNVVTVVIDNGSSPLPGVGDDSTSTDTNDPVYVGGVPEFQKGHKTQTQYVGCIRNLKFDRVLQDLSGGQPSGRVSLDTCPTS